MADAFLGRPEIRQILLTEPVRGVVSAQSAQ
jgi:hypothetical protein